MSKTHSHQAPGSSSALIKTAAAGRTQPLDAASAILLVEKTNRSLYADIEVRAHSVGASLKTTPLRLEGVEIATACSFEHRLCGLPTGIHDGAVALSAHWEPRLMPWLWDRLQEATAFDLATYRIAKTAMGNTAPKRFAMTNRSVMALVQRNSAKEVMPLGHTFDDFRKQLGRSTRRNANFCLEYAAQNAVRFSFSLEPPPRPEAPLRELAAHNMPRPQPFWKVLRVVEFVARQQRPYHASLMDRDGRLMSVAGGFIEGDLALMAYQLNHRAAQDAQPSLTLRILLAQQLIDCGARHLAFIGGCSGVLWNYCDQVLAAELLLVRNTRSAQLKHRACLLLAPTSRIADLSERSRELPNCDAWPVNAGVGPPP